MCQRCETVNDIRYWGTKDDAAYHRAVDHSNDAYRRMATPDKTLMQIWWQHFYARLRHGGLADVCAYTYLIETSRIVFDERGKWHYAPQLPN